MNQKKLNYAWIIVFACFVLMFSSVGIMVSSVSVFLKPVTEALQFTRAQFTLIGTIGGLISLFFAPFAGKILTKMNLRFTMSFGAILAGIGYFSFSRSITLLQFYLSSIPIGISLMLLTVIPCSMMLSNWFEEKRGLAMGIAFTGSGVGAMVYVPLANWLIVEYGFRTAYLVFSIVLLVTLLPITLFIVSRSPADKGLVAYGTKNLNSDSNLVSDVGMTLSQSVKGMSFWIFGLATFMIGLVNSGTQQHIPVFLSDAGYSTTFAATVVSAFMAVTILGKILLGILFDKKGSIFSVSYCCIIMIISIICLWFAKTNVFLILFIITYGLSLPIVTLVPPYITRELFGNKDYGVIYSFINIFYSLGMAFGAPLSGLFYDKQGSYFSAFALYCIINVVIMIFTFFCVSKGKNKLSSVIAQQQK